MATVLITILSPYREIDVEVPAEVPVTELIAPLLTLCVPFTGVGQLPVGDTWRIGRRGDAPFPVTKSLVDCSVLDGTRLLMREVADWQSEQERERRPEPDIADASRAGGIEIRWNREGLLPGS